MRRLWHEHCFPATEFESDLAAIAGIADLLRTGFENPEGIPGTVRHDMDREMDTQVTIPTATIHRIFNGFEFRPENPDCETYLKAKDAKCPWVTPNPGAFSCICPMPRLCNLASSYR